MTFDECVKAKKPECTKDKFLFTIIPHFCGQHDFCLKQSRTALIHAKQNVIKYFPVVGYLEEFDKLVELLQLVWPKFYRGSVRLYSQIKDQPRTRHRTVNMKKPNEVTREALMPRLGLEYDFYKFIKYRFHCMYEQYLGKKTYKFHRNI